MPYHDDDDLEQNNRHENAKQHSLTLHLEELSETLKVLLAYPENENELVNTHIRLIQESLQLIKAKVYAALRSDSYLVCMQNAATVRSHANYLLVACHTLNSLKSFDKEHVAVFRKEMEEFRELFKAWAQEIKSMDRDGLEDEWGLF